MQYSKNIIENLITRERSVWLVLRSAFLEEKVDYDTPNYTFVYIRKILKCIKWIRKFYSYEGFSLRQKN